MESEDFEQIQNSNSPLDNSLNISLLSNDMYCTPTKDSFELKIQKTLDMKETHLFSSYVKAPVPHHRLLS